MLLLARENKIRILKPPCNFLCIISTNWLFAQTTVKRRKMTSSVSSLARIWKIRQSGPGCSFVWILRVVYFPVKYSCPCNKRDISWFSLYFFFLVLFQSLWPFFLGTMPKQKQKQQHQQKQKKRRPTPILIQSAQLNWVKRWTFHALKTWMISS